MKPKKTFLKYFFTTNYGKFVGMLGCLIVIFALNTQAAGTIPTNIITVVFTFVIAGLVYESYYDWKNYTKQ